MRPWRAEKVGSVTGLPKPERQAVMADRDSAMNPKGIGGGGTPTARYDRSFQNAKRLVVYSGVPTMAGVLCNVMEWGEFEVNRSHGVSFFLA